MAAELAAAGTRHEATAVTVARALELAAGDRIPRGPWRHYRAHDGALIVEDIETGEPVAQVYAGLPLALYLEALTPAELEADR
jgi:hypothetical protein